MELVAGFAKAFWFGEQGGYNVLVTELLGPSLEDLLNLCHRHFSLKTVLLLADQMIRRIELLHSKGFVHRDIKPENFLVGIGARTSTVYLIDFGLAKRFRDPVSGLHVPFRDRKPFTGTARYASVNTHVGAEQSRRDDLEALGYLFVYLSAGGLPWQNLPAKTRQEKYEKIMERKITTSTEKLCHGLPQTFATYISYCRRMKFNERPDYLYMVKSFKELFSQQAYLYDQVFDWTAPIRVINPQSYVRSRSKPSRERHCSEPRL